MSVINEACGGATSTKNTGSKKQCLEGAVRAYVLAKDGFSFANITDLKDKSKWDEAKKNKDIVPFYDIEALEQSNIDAVNLEGRFRTYPIKDAIKGVNYTHYLSSCSHDAVSSYDSSNEYTKIFRITEKNEVLCEVQEDGSIKGEPLTSFIVGVRNDATTDAPPSTQIQLKFDAYSLSIIKPSFDLTEYEGIYDVSLEVPTDSLGAPIVSTATSLKIAVTAGCAGNKSIETLIAADFIVKDGVGAVQSVTFVGYDAANKLYELTGAGFATGFTVELNGVIAQTTVMYEALAPLTLTI